MTELYDAACTFIDAGWSPIPLRGKVPVTKKWTDAASSKADAYGWWVEDGHDGIGVACGHLSGGLVVIDIEGRLAADTARMGQVMAHAEDSGVAHLLSDAANRASARTPSGGLHLFLRITDAPVPGNTKLAYSKIGPGQTAKDYALLAETRGEGGQVAVPPAPGRVWLGASGPGSRIDVTMDEYARLIACFSVLDESQRLSFAPRPAKPAERIGGVFDTTHDGPTVASAFTDALMAGELTWADVLDPGWTHTGYDREGRSLWLRPEYGGVKSTALSSAHGFERYIGGPAPVLVVHSAAVMHLPTGDRQRLTPARVWALSHGYGDEASAYAAIEDAIADGDLDVLEQLPPAVLPRLEPIVAAKRTTPAPSPAALEQLDAALTRAPEPTSEHRTGIDLDTLPPVLRDAVATLAANTQTDPALGALLGLAALSAATASGFRFGGAGWTEAPCLWTVVAADPSERKSAVLDRIAMKPVLAAQTKVKRELADVVMEYRSEAAWLEAELLLARDAAKKAPEPERAAASRRVIEAEAALADHADTEPVEPRYVISEGTPEAVLDVMARNAGNAAVLSAEGTFLQIVAGGYSDRSKPSPAALALNASWSAEPVISVRRGSPTVEVPRSFLAIGMAVQPEVIDVLASRTLTGTGFTARWLLCVVPKRRRPMSVTAPALDEAAMTRWENLVGAVMYRGWGNVAQPERIDLSPAALEHYRAWLGTAYQRTVVVDDDLTAWWGKAHGQALRVAGLFQLAIDPGSIVIGVDAVTLALRFMEWAAERTAELLGGRLSSLGDMSSEALAGEHLQVLRWARKKHPDSWWRLRDLQRNGPAKRWVFPAGAKPADAIREVLADLVARGELEARVVESASVSSSAVAEYRLVATQGSEKATRGEKATPGDTQSPASSQVVTAVALVASSHQETIKGYISSSPEVPEPLSPGDTATRGDTATPGAPECRTCGGSIDPALAAAGLDSHPSCPPAVAS